MSVSIDELFEMLRWDSDEETQKRGIEIGKKVDCLSVFLQPHGTLHGKNIWDNCAKILVSFPDEILRNYLLELLYWIEDINWPGAEIVLNRLIEFSETSFFSIFISRCVKSALACDKQNWLGNMSDLLLNENIKKDLPKDIFNVLYNRRFCKTQIL